MLQEFTDHPHPASTNQTTRPRLDDRFLINLKGKDFVTYAGLLDLAHQQGLARLEVELIQHPNPENGNEAVCRAVAESSSGQVFSDWGDASPTNTNKMISAHLIRMASTRAKARALRDLTNIGITSLEELGGDMEDYGNGNGAKSRNTKKGPSASATSPKPVAPANTQSNNQPISDAQRRAIINLGLRKGFDDQELNSMAAEIFGIEMDHLSMKDASAFIVHLQQ